MNWTVCSYEWERGNHVKKTGSLIFVSGSSSSTAPSQLDKIPPWLSITPLGLPDVPDV